jgi:hypothetical protein
MFPMRAFTILFCLFLVTATADAAEVRLIRVWPGWREAEDFERIGEFFGRPKNENSGREIVLRTNDAARAGYYFLVRLKSTAPIASAKFELGVIRPDALKATTFEFPVTLRQGETVYQLGLTGPAWPEGKDAHPVAWRFALVASDGRVLAEQKSFLWEKPAK